MARNLIMMVGVMSIFLIAFIVLSFPTQDIYISDMEYTVLKAEWAQPSRDLTIDGNPIRINGKFYPKGLGVHADSEISVEVPPRRDYLVAEIGINDEIGEDQAASVIFQVISDGTVLYESALLTPNMLPRRIKVDVKGLEFINLTVDGGPDGNNADHADWAMIRFTGK
jgi:hypothetical protein